MQAGSSSRRGLPPRIMFVDWEVTPAPQWPLAAATHIVPRGTAKPDWAMGFLPGAESRLSSASSSLQPGFILWSQEPGLLSQLDR